jgi:hypothetical protein
VSLLGDEGLVPALLWPLDGVMRCLPIAALYDGHRYMAERFDKPRLSALTFMFMAVLAK